MPSKAPVPDPLTASVPVIRPLAPWRIKIMRHPKRHLLSMLALSVSLFSCASFAATKLTLVEVITSPARTEMLQKMLTAYQAQHPDVEIEVVSLPWGQRLKNWAP